MRTPSTWLAMLFVVSSVGLGCSSGSDALTCSNPSAEQQSCADCASSACSSETSSAESACATVLSCESACSCSDNTCMQKCNSNVSPACLSAFADVAKCGESQCKTQCTVTLDGG
jgi:hypothetical protein